MVTIKDIARELNLSYSSISLALNDDPRIKKETRERVKLKAEEMGYQRNAQARALVMNKSEMIGFILPDIENPFFASLIRGAEELAFEKGFNLVICNTNWDNELEAKHLNLVIERKIDGILLVSCNEPNPTLERVLSLKLPLVFVSSPYPEAEANFVGTDSEHGGYLAAKHLLDLGHREFVVIGGQFNSEAIIQRFNGYKRALNDYNIILNKDDVILGDFSVNSGFKSIKNLLKRNRKFTAILAFDDLIAIGVLNGIKESGLSIPQDISVIGFDNIEASSFKGIDLTTISMDKSSMGRLAVEILLEDLNCKNKQCDINNIVLDQELIIRQSTGPVKE
ncbi:MAG: LacI family DNA-binding transcriptional regulator [Spirochaetales bacterium]|nr:LacI family DNA-binding transcriptional regulator [Spirochaetales bacterium]